MTDRPCKLDADVKRLWRFFLPGTAVPACGSGEGQDPAPERTDKRSPESADADAPPVPTGR